MNDYDDIPGTYVMDGAHSRKGYRLNMFCMSLNQPEARERFRQDEASCLAGCGLTPEQVQAVRERDYLRMLQLGGNIYYVFKIAACDGKSMQYVGAQMSGVTEDDFKAMMLGGGRSAAGNRFVDQPEVQE